MSKKTAIVTGASSGIGRATALQLVAQGYSVYAAARRTEKMAEAQVEGLIPTYLDITSEEAISKLIDKIMDETGRIDVLVNNAGYGLMGTIEETSLEEARQQFDVNVFGLMNLTQKVLPIMRRQRQGHIINISSVVGRVGLPINGWYSASKHALEALSDALRIETRPFGIKVTVIEPGAIKTEFSDVAKEKAKNVTQLEPYRQLSSRYQEMSASFSDSAAEPYEVAKVIGEIVVAKSPRPRYAVPGQAKALLIGKRILGDRLFDWFMTRQLRWR
ncbi:MAG: SDR family NAD(P)-dependent oxidoreductase [Trueperaceae bacterium]|nr:SDR family NAD(P)-dependent oxidoreductase [Trueperaceae bacterium]